MQTSIIIFGEIKSITITKKYITITVHNTNIVTPFIAKSIFVVKAHIAKPKATPVAIINSK